MSSHPNIERPLSRSWTPEDLEKLDPRYTWVFKWSKAAPGPNDVFHVALITGEEVEHVQLGPGLEELRPTNILRIFLPDGQMRDLHIIGVDKAAAPSHGWLKQQMEDHYKAGHTQGTKDGQEDFLRQFRERPYTLRCKCPSCGENVFGTAQIV